MLFFLEATICLLLQQRNIERCKRKNQQQKLKSSEFFPFFIYFLITVVSVSCCCEKFIKVVLQSGGKGKRRSRVSFVKKKEKKSEENCKVQVTLDLFIYLFFSKCDLASNSSSGITSSRSNSSSRSIPY